MERAAGTVETAKSALDAKIALRDTLAKKAAKGEDVATDLALAEEGVVTLTAELADAQQDHVDLKKLYETALQNLKKFADNNQTLGPAASPQKGKFKPGAAANIQTFFFMEDGQMKQGKRDKEAVEGDPTLMQYAVKALRTDFRRRPQESPMSIADILTFSKEKTIPQSLTIIPASRIEDLRLAVECWARLQAYLSGAYHKPAALQEFLVWILTQGRVYVQLRDELYVQLLRQLRLLYNKSSKGTLCRGWMLMRFYTTTFPPSHALHKHLNAFLYYMEQEALKGRLGGLPSANQGSGGGNVGTGFRRKTHAEVGTASSEEGAFKIPENVLRQSPEWCRAALKHTKLNGVRKFSPSVEEIEHVQSAEDMDLAVHFLNGEVELVKVSPSLTAQELVEELAGVLKLEDSHGWSLFSIYDDHEDQIRGMEYVGDVLGMWETEQRRVVAAAKREFPELRVLSQEEYSSILAKMEDPPAPTPAKQQKHHAPLVTLKQRKTKYVLGFERRRDPTELAGEIRPPLLVFKKRLFIKDKIKPKGPIEQSLLYAQAVNSVLTYQLPLPVKEALVLGGLQARIELDSFANFNVSQLADITEAHYGRLERFLSDRLLDNFQREHKRERDDWLQLLAKKHRDVPDNHDKDQCRTEYLKVAMNSPLFGASLYPAAYIGFWCFPQTIEIDIHEHGVRFIHRTTKEELRSYIWSRLENLQLTTANDQAVAAGRGDHENEFTDRITFSLNRLSKDEDPLVREQLEFTFESTHSRDIAQMISSYSPDKKHQQWMKSRDEEARSKRALLTETEKSALQRKLWLLRCQMFDLGVLTRRSRGAPPPKGAISTASPSSALRRTTMGSTPDFRRLSSVDLEVNVDAVLLKNLQDEYSNNFWEFTRDAADKVAPLSSLILPTPAQVAAAAAIAAASGSLPPTSMPSNISKEDLAKHAQRLMASIRIYAGIDTVGGFFVATDKSRIPMVQACISRCIESAVLCDEFFLQLVRMTTTGPRARCSPKESLEIWKLFCIVCGVVAPHNDTVYDYVITHLQNLSNAVSEEAKHARYCLQNVIISHTKRSRTFPPSAVEQLCAANLSEIQTRVFLLSKQFQTYLHGPHTTMAELRQLVKTKIGLPPDIDYYTLFEVFGGAKMEREMQPKENVCDILFKWEK